MARTLSVYLARRLVGELEQDDGGQMWFRYDTAWLDSADSFPISHSLPLQDAPFNQKACQGFFGGTLPEDANRRVIARILQISDKNDFALLARIGGECAGALIFIPQGETLPPADSEYLPLSEAELHDILTVLDRRPLLAGEKGVRLSLAGAQDKLAVALDNEGRLSLPLHYAPSTHILKPALSTWGGIVSNENYCMALALACGLNAAATSAHSVAGIDYLLSERFDRSRMAEGAIRRLHQEDFCQALGVRSEIKYQADGGPGLADCFAVLRQVSTDIVRDVRDLLEAVLFNLLIGNNDAHAKNYSVLYSENGSARLAPLYDLVCTVYYPEIENRLAMKIGGEANPDLVGPAHLEAFAKEAGLGPAAVRRNLIELAVRVQARAGEVLQPDHTAQGVAEIVMQRCERVLLRFRR
ncbi:MAG: type II toxin-antitoxin system HipA family toxin [Pseudomonadota bacterium]